MASADAPFKRIAGDDMRALVLAALTLLGCLAGAAARADVEIDGVKYAPSVKLDGQPLRLNGAATKTNKLGVRNFSVAVYAAESGRSAEALLAAPGPKRIVFKFLKPVTADAMGFLTRGVEANLERADTVKTINGVVRLGTLLGSHPTFAAGDSLAIDYQPGKGSFLAINGKAEALPVVEPEFFKAMLLIWVGAQPVDSKMKVGILGG
jgi:hypothetical protein